MSQWPGLCPSLMASCPEHPSAPAWGVHSRVAGGALLGHRAWPSREVRGQTGSSGADFPSRPSALAGSPTCHLGPGP